jgi:hypothetical protein
VIEVFKKWMTFYFEDFTEENAIFFNMFLSDLGTKGFEAHADDLRTVFRTQGDAYRKRLAQEEIDAEKERVAQAASDDIVNRLPDLEDDDHDPADIARQMTLIEERVQSPRMFGVAGLQLGVELTCVPRRNAALQADLPQRVPTTGMEQKGWQRQGYARTHARTAWVDGWNAIRQDC